MRLLKRVCWRLPAVSLLFQLFSGKAKILERNPDALTVVKKTNIPFVYDNITIIKEAMTQAEYRVKQTAEVMKSKRKE